MRDDVQRATDGVSRRLWVTLLHGLLGFSGEAKQAFVEHDQQIAMISHLPHVLATLLSAGTTGDQLPLVGPGWLDTTRVAAGDVQLWRQIFQQNKVHVLKSVDKFGQLLTSFREALAKDDMGKITRLLETGKQNRDAVGN